MTSQYPEDLPRAAPCDRHPCPFCRKEAESARFWAARKKYEGPELVFWGSLLALINGGLVLAIAAAFFEPFGDWAGPPPRLEAGADFHLVFGIALSLIALDGSVIIAKGIRIWRKHPTTGTTRPRAAARTRLASVKNRQARPLPAATPRPDEPEHK